MSGAGATRGVVRRDQLLDHSPAALFVDDVDLLGGVTPEHVANWSSTGAFVCVTLPATGVGGDRRDTYLDPGWARVADLVLEVRIHDLSDEDGRDRLGEADLSVLKNRRGPLCDVDRRIPGVLLTFRRPEPLTFAGSAKSAWSRCEVSPCNLPATDVTSLAASCALTSRFTASPTKRRIILSAFTPGRPSNIPK